MELKFDFEGIDLVYRNTTKGNKCLYVCNYLYYYKRTNANRTSNWVCHEKKCNASVSIKIKCKFVSRIGSQSIALRACDYGA
jgi:hypothetical protein